MKNFFHAKWILTLILLSTSTQMSGWPSTSVNAAPPMCLELPLNSFLALEADFPETDDQKDTAVVEQIETPSGALIGSEASAIERVLTEAEKLHSQDWVPYVWGGQKIGSEAECVKCHECVARKKVRPERMLQKCSACKHCGIDCSHFVAQVFRNAEMPIKYGTTREWKKLGPAELLERYQLRDMGSDINDARPADILLYDGHVVMLIELTGNRRGTIIHATRRGKFGGGIRIDDDVDLQRFHGKLRKILRHQDLSGDEGSEAQDSGT